MTTPQPDGPEPAAAEETLASLGQVAGELIHDMANLVSVLDGRLRLALGGARSGRTPVAELERAADGCGELGAMLRDVLATLRDEALTPEMGMQPEVVAERAIRRTIEICRPVEIRMSSSLPARAVVPGRASFLYRAVSNLLANAARHAAHRIEVTLEPGEGGRGVVVAVEDDGAGIRPENREALFRPLFRGDPGGTGLGLSSVAWTVRQLGGRVRCTAGSRLGGARFEIFLPGGSPGSGPGPSTPRPAALAGKRVLVLDDNVDVRSALGRLLRRVGAEVVELGPEAGGEEQILNAVIRSVPDAVLLDLNLGARSGVEVWSLLREQIPPLADRVVFLSGAGPGDAVYEAALRTGVRILPKPFDFGELAASLEEIVHTA
ncbi:MAG TPA: ATP-binding protein [Longimicrobiaceae bacterium]|nr:ATP-binding protein [Longimicrobiaceae bacterium]